MDGSGRPIEAADVIALWWVNHSESIGTASESVGDCERVPRLSG